MRWSNLFAPTLREAPADAVITSHQLLLRGGFIRQLHAGHYSLLPLGLRVHKKVAAIVSEEMDAIGARRRCSRPFTRLGCGSAADAGKQWAKRCSGSETAGATTMHWE